MRYETPERHSDKTMAKCLRILNTIVTKCIPILRQTTH